MSDEFTIPDDPVELRKLIEETEDYEDKGELTRIFTEKTMDAIPVPQCCQKQRTHPTMYWSVDYGWPTEKNSKKANGSWKSNLGHQELDNYYLRKYKSSMKWYEERPEPKFCNYCGDNLPKFVRKKKFPKYTHIAKKGSGYCETCKERNMSCYCWPPEHAWQMEKP